MRGAAHERRCSEARIASWAPIPVHSRAQAQARARAGVRKREMAHICLPRSRMCRYVPSRAIRGVAHVRRLRTVHALATQKRTKKSCAESRAAREKKPSVLARSDGSNRACPCPRIAESTTLAALQPLSRATRSGHLEIYNCTSTHHARRRSSLVVGRATALARLWCGRQTRGGSCTQRRHPSR